VSSSNNLINVNNNFYATYLKNVHDTIASDCFDCLSNVADKVQHLATEFKEHYYNSKMFPEACDNAKMDRNIYIPTASFLQHSTFTITPNASGRFALVFNPFFMGQQALIARTSCFVNASAAVDGVTPDPNFIGVDLGQTISTTNVYSQYGLAAASLQIRNVDSQLNISGTFSGGIINDPTVIDVPVSPPTTTGTMGNYALQNVADDSIYNQIVKSEDGLRMLYFPLDPTFETFYAVNTVKAGFNWIVFGQGLRGSAPIVRVDLYLRYEAFPYQNFMALIPRTLGTAKPIKIRDKHNQDTMNNSIRSLKDSKDMTSDKNDNDELIKQIISEYTKDMSERIKNRIKLLK